ncbi:DUF4290 domain-containing protein [Rufibacter glacialis]|uniref:DUF4290 domain-containing protein n=1 Tax=Rufibacter glacialis TaxID=1259555 RepID=A0A5M8QI76_9BACT|nr:DUF4290 domain-containing protein [Rufibacter glacialis]KAA6434674.1 DUF4290 domain-containing protein [Rufibacter glacialis]GGK71514.1 hypothetical protein GCM10011405_19630 [Rufibacter glacialis]
MVASSSFKQELLLREYGRNVQNIVQYILTVEDRTKRNQLAQLLVNLMGRLNPNVKDIQDAQHTLWNHLFVMSDGKLDVDAPFELSAMDYLNDKPQRVDYPTQTPRYKHYGSNLERLIDKAKQINDPQEREAAIISIGKLMKVLYRTYNKDSVTDEVILENLRELSKKELDLDPSLLEKGNLFESTIKTPQGPGNNFQREQSNQKYKNNNNQNKNNQNRSKNK